MRKYTSHDYNRKKIMHECEALNNLEEEIEYLVKVKHEYLTNRPAMDVNQFEKVGLVEFLDEQIEYREKKVEVSMDNYKKTNIVGKIKLVDGKGYSDIVRIFEAMKRTEIIDKSTKVTEIAQLFFEEKKTFTEKYYSTKSTNINYKTNSISDKLYDFITLVIEGAYKERQNKKDELIEFIDKL